MKTISKYKNNKTVICGIRFDSKKEANRYLQLKEMEDRGEITNLQLQVKYELIPRQTINGRVVERSCNYIADFQYEQNGEVIVEDSKGKKTPEYIIKRKLMLSVYGIKIQEV